MVIYNMKNWILSSSLFLTFHFIEIMLFSINFNIRLRCSGQVNVIYCDAAASSVIIPATTT